MKKRAFLILISVSSLAALPVCAATQVVELLPGGTQVPVHIVGTISSSSAKVDETFTIAASQDVIVDNRIVIKQGAQGLGEVASVSQAGGGE